MAVIPEYKYQVFFRVLWSADPDLERADPNGPYATPELAEEHRRDIAGYEGIADCHIRMVDVGKVNEAGRST